MSKRGENPRSLAAFHAGKLEGIFSRREAEILRAFRDLGRATDREVCAYLGLPDMNCVRPRINELRDDGILEEAGEQVCPVTKKQVRICRLAALREEQPSLPLEGAA